MFCPSLKWKVIAQKWTIDVTNVKNLLVHLVPNSEKCRIENTLQQILKRAVFTFSGFFHFFPPFIVINNQYIQKIKKQPQMPV